MKREDLELLRQALDRINALERENAQLKAEDMSIAVVGIGCRLPGGIADPGSYWEFLNAGGDGIRPLPEQRMAWFEALEPGFAAKVTTTRGGYLDGVDLFDPSFFGISPKEAKLMDPQQRLLLEVAWESLEDAGIRPSQLRGTQTGVFVGITLTDYHHYLTGQQDTGALGVTSASHNAAAGRLAYQLGLQGPCMAVDTACSSSLVAIDLAVRYLRMGGCECALAGGVNLILSPDSMVATSTANMLSPDGRCFTFDAAANGIVRGEGCGVVVLKPLEAALRDGDRLYAVIAGTAQNNNGTGSGITVPNRAAQATLLKAALSNAAVNPAEVTFVEAHGTATPLGDPIEVQAVNDVFGQSRLQGQPIHLGAVKAHFGHLEAAAGIAGFIKAALCLHHGSLPAQPCFQRPNPHLDWASMPVHVPTIPVALPSNAVAGVSSFGATGTNAHVVLKAAPAQPVRPPSAESTIFLPLYARTEAALQSMAARLAARILPGTDLAALAAGARRGRELFPHRAVVVAKGAEACKAALEAFALGKPHEAVRSGTADHNATKGYVGMFTGQGSQHPGMARELYAIWPAFREAMDECASAAEGLLPMPLPQVIMEGGDAIHDTQYAQPALFAVEYSLARAMAQMGLQPVAVLGHSLGEFVAACVAGIFSVQEAMRVVCKRGALMQSMPAGGKMTAALATADEVRAVLGGFPRLSIAALNGPKQTVVSGIAEDMEAFVQACKSKSIATTPLQVSHAFHSAMMDEAAAAFEEYMGTVKFGKAKIPVVSTLTGRILTDEEARSPRYWSRQLREAVDLLAAARFLGNAGHGCFVEMGPRPFLSRMVQGILGGDVRVIPSLDGEMPADQAFLKMLAALHVLGHPIDWTAYDSLHPVAHLGLPTYPFQRKSYWVEPKTLLPQPLLAATSVMDTRIETVMPQSQNSAAASNLREEIARMVAQITEIPAQELPADTNFFELGMDSIMIIQLRQDLHQTFGVDVSLSDFYTTYDTLAKLTAFVAGQVDVVEVPAKQPVTEGSQPAQEAPTTGNAFVEEVIRQQMDIMRAQLALLRGEPAVEARSTQGHKAQIKQAAEAFVPYRKVDNGQSGAALEIPDNLRAFMDRVVGSTLSSKEATAHYRAFLANNRAVAGFRPNWKEMIYQLVVDRAEGSKIWDPAGREYVDFTMGFGVYLFGHQPAFVRKSVQEAMDRGLPVGPMTTMAGQVAEELCAMTGMERAAFYNSGTEAVMVALRLARTTTGRKKVVIFAGSYHGTFDGILAKQGTGEDVHLGLPVAPGIPEGMLEDVYVLNYADEASLAFIETEGPTLAAVLVEPVQSRRPDLQPTDFLRSLRDITSRHGTALIFDEVITGFRIHPGGAQHHFGVSADLATYGKVIGGGMPIGIVAGKSDFLDGVDGGHWQYGDASYPAQRTTFVAGTFCHHPLAMSAALAVMQELRSRGPSLQDDLNARTSALCAELNDWYRQEGFPLQMVNFGSLFRFVLKGNYELLFFALLERGFYIWEGRNCFLSTAHSDADVRAFIEAVKSSLLELRELGLVPPASGKQHPGGIVPKAPKQDRYPVNPAQRAMWLAIEMDQEVARYNLGVALRLEGELDTALLQAALQALISRHDMMRASFVATDGEPEMRVQDALPLQLEVVKLDGEDWMQALQQQGEMEMDLANAPLWRMSLLETATDRHVLAILIHHLISDGWSLNVLLAELLAIYEASVKGTQPALAPLAFQGQDYAVWLETEAGQNRLLPSRAFWHERMGRGVVKLPLRSDQSSLETNRLRRTYPAARLGGLREWGHRSGGSLFSLLESLLAISLHHRLGAGTLAIGTPMAGRMLPGMSGQVGLYLNMVTLHVDLNDPQERVADLVRRLHSQNQRVYDHQDYPFSQLVQELNPPRVRGRHPFFEVELALDSYDRNAGVMELLGGRLRAEAVQEAVLADPRKFTLEFKFMELAEGLTLDVLYDPALLEGAWVQGLLESVERGMALVLGDPQVTVAALAPEPQQGAGKSPLRPMTRSSAGPFSPSEQLGD